MNYDANHKIESKSLTEKLLSSFFINKSMMCSGLLGSLQIKYLDFNTVVIVILATLNL